MLGLSWDAWYTAGVVVLMILGLVREVARPFLVMLACLGLLLIAGVVEAETAFQGFSNPAVLTIAALFVVAAGVQRTNAIAFLDRLLFGDARGLTQTLARLMSPVVLLSAVLNNTPVVAMLIPRVQRWARDRGVAVSKLLIPLSYAAVLGGMMTLIGTSTNLVVSGFLQEATGEGFGLFTLSWVGVPAALVGLVYMLTVGRRLLPDYAHDGSAPMEPLSDYHFELRIPGGAPIVGRTVQEAGLRNLQSAFLMHVHRGDQVVGPVGPDEVLQAGDVLAFTGPPTALDALAERRDLERTAPDLDAGTLDLPLFEAVLSRSSSLIGRTLKEVGFRERYGGVVLAIRRSDEELIGGLGNMPLKAGDLLLIEARPDFDVRWNADREDFYLVAPFHSERPLPERARKAPLALAVLLAVIVLSSLGVVSLVAAAYVAALVMVATKCLRLADARQALDMPVLLMIAAAFGIGGAVQETGLAAVVAQGLVDLVAGFGPFAVLVALYMATNIMTELLTNAAAAALTFPVALATATDLGLDPLPFAVAVAIAGSAGFSTPFGYQTNLMVMGAGGYRFTDFVRVGLPLNLLLMVVAVTVIGAVWL